MRLSCVLGTGTDSLSTTTIGEISQNSIRMQAWKTLKQSSVISASPWLEVYRELVQLPDARILDDFYRIVLPDFAVVVPVTEIGELVMTRSYKHGPRRITLNAPAGFLNPGEPPLQAAQRELFEETGYRSSEWQSLGSFMVDGNRQCGTAHLFLARNASRVAPASNPDVNEIVEVELVSPRAFYQAVTGGEVVLLSTVCAVSLAMLVQNQCGKRIAMSEVTKKP